MFGEGRHAHHSLGGHGRMPTRDISRSETRQNNNKTVSVLPALSRMRSTANKPAARRMIGNRNNY